MAAWRSGSLSRSLLATARSSSVRSSPRLPRLRPTSFAAPPPTRRRLSFLHPRSLGSWDARSRSFRFTAWLPRPASRRTSRWSPALAASSHRVPSAALVRIASSFSLYLSSNRVGAVVMLLRAGTTTIGIVTL